MNSTYIVFPAKEQVRVEQEILAPPGKGEILCAASSSLISLGTESFCLRGVFDRGTNWETWAQYPFRPGYSMAARVIAIGEGVKDFREGDRVVARVPHQQYFISPPDRLYKLPDKITDEEAAWATIATTAQLGVRRAKLALGESVGVVGMGMLGQLTVQYLAVAGSGQVIAIDKNPPRLKLARAHGVTNVIASPAENAQAGIELLTQGKMLDVVFDVTGNPHVLAAACQLLRPFGRLVLLGDTPTPSQQHLGPGVVANSLAILGVHALARPAQGSHFYPWGAKEMIALFFNYLMQGRMRVQDLITHRFSPLDAPNVYEMLARDHSSAVGVLFDWTLLGANN